jgi:hypothetical protein
MKKIISAFSKLSETQLIALITALSVLITLRVIYIQHGWINNDSVLYFEVARLFAAGEWKDGFSLYNWPLYPALLALLHKLTSVSIQHAAQVLNVIFFAITTYSFVTLIRLAGGNKATLICGSLLLLSSSYIAGDVLPMLLRDQGFWAFYLTSLVFFIRFYRDGKLSDALLWQSCAMLAVLFRIEAVTFLVLLPFAIISNPAILKRTAILRTLQASVFTLSAIAAILIVLVVIPTITLADFGRIQEIAKIFTTAYLQITDGLHQKSLIMGKSVLGPYLDDYGMMGVVLTLIGIAIYKIAGTAGWGTIVLLGATTKIKPDSLDRDALRVFCWVGALALLNASMIILSTFVLSSRYVIALAFILMILASFNFATLFKHAWGRQDAVKKWLLAILVLVLVLSCIKNLLPNGAEHNYQQNAAKWLNAHSTKDSVVFIDNPRLRYYAAKPYAGRGMDEWQLVLQAIQDHSINGYDFLLISLDEDYPQREKYLTETLTHHRLVEKFNKTDSEKAVLVFVKK